MQAIPCVSQTFDGGDLPTIAVVHICQTLLEKEKRVDMKLLSWAMRLAYFLQS